MTKWITNLTTLSNKDWERYRQNAFDISRIALWDNLVENYSQAYEIAINKKIESGESFDKQMPMQLSTITETLSSSPEWKKVFIQSHLPKELEKLKELAMNMWWCWNYEAVNLFQSINTEKWETFNRNPLAILDSLSVSELRTLSNNSDFIHTLNSVYSKFRAYMDEKPNPDTPQVAYFSMEFGLHESVKIYSGGLGILAGDYLKEASDCNYNMIGIGLMYRYGYFIQQISLNGEQTAQYVPQRFAQLPLNPVRLENGEWVMVRISLPGRLLHAKVWRLNVGRVPLYLLDTDIPENSDADRSITHQLYGGDWENRFKQELLLGVGGVRALNRMCIRPDVFHCNEGHAAFIGLERLRVMIEDERKSFPVAKELVRSSSLFTTHTPVPAGHDAFDENLLRTYISHYPKRLNIEWDDFMGLGRKNKHDSNEKFSMSILAANLSQEMNGVSRIHGRVSREMFAYLYDGYFAEEIHIGYVTNGVHYETWTHEKWQKLYLKHFGNDFLKNLSDDKYWQKIHDVDDSHINDIRNSLRNELITFVKKRLYDDMTRREENPNLILKSIETLSANKLTIGFARRFATYKRAHLLFKNIERLNQIVNNPGLPVQFIFAGKAHPADKAGQDLIKNIIEISRRPEFAGKIVFLENYDVEVAQKLVQGVDIWMNTPTRPLEASGTSGEKAIMNGVMNLSVLDGWWAEGYKKDAGWALKEEQTYTNTYFQDNLDAETIYNIIENEIAPTFYEKDHNGLPHRWIKIVKNCISEIAPHFTMKRQLDDYILQYYNPLFKRSTLLKAHNGAQAEIISDWKHKMQEVWDKIEVLHVKYPDSTKRALMLGEIFHTEVLLDLKGLDSSEIGVEILFGSKILNKVEFIKRKVTLQPVNVEGGFVAYRADIVTALTGVYDFAYRIYPKNEMLPHRQDFNLIKWA